MGEKIRGHIRSNVVGYVALFIALSGTAYATHPGGANTISSGDIIAAEVKNPDLAPNSVASGKIIDGTVQSADVANDTTGFGLTSQDLANSSVGSSEVAFNSLTGDDIDESTLDIGSAPLQAEDDCDPNSSSPVVCASVELPLSDGDVFLVTATGGWFGAEGAGRADAGTCQLFRRTVTTNPSPLAGQLSLGQAGDQFNTTTRLSGFALTATAQAFSGQRTFVGLQCNEVDADIRFDDITITAAVIFTR